MHTRSIQFSVFSTLSIFTAAFLVFLIQPLIARQLLPFMGGSPQVWNTVMVFFQAALLLGYLLAFALARIQSLRLQSLLFIGIVVLAAIQLPFSIESPVDNTVSPSGWLLWQLSISVGLPFMVLAAVSPLLQSWYARSRAKGAKDPYFLYSASNTGSLLALLGYPLLIEPGLGTQQQTLLWSLSYGVVALLMTASAWRLMSTTAEQRSIVEEQGGAVSTRQLLLWIALAFVPSSHLLGVTTFLTTDLAPVPLLWVAPLALYLLSFILVFARRQWSGLSHFNRWLSPALLVLALLTATGTSQPLALIGSLHLLIFFVTAIAFHGVLVAKRPPSRHLTLFYLCLSTGGVLGGAFNALLAPQLFNDLYEYLLIPALGLLIMGLAETADEPQKKRWPWAYALAPAAWILLASTDWLSSALAQAAIIGLGTLALLPLLKHRLPLAVATGLWTLSTVVLYQQDGAEVRLQERSFFGVHRVLYTHDDDTLWLEHGPTLHGKQSHDEELKDVPGAYYHRTGPAGPLLSRQTDTQRVGIVGLGAGTLAAYAKPGDDFHFFEIDPTVIRLASGGEHFSYLARARERGAQVSVTLGDARLSLAQNDPDKFDLLIIDAFSSDSIPLHLTTVEAMQLYRQKLTDSGSILFHISNDYLNLIEPVSLAAIKAGLTAHVQYDDQVDSQQAQEGKLPSLWLHMSTSNTAPSPRWRSVQLDTGQRAWSDDYVNLMDAL